MSEPVRLLQLGRVPDWQSQAIFHALAEAMTGDSLDTIVVCQPASPYISIGYHQSLDAVLDPAECARLGLPIFRRHVGGGTTLLDSNQLFYQCIFHRTRVPAIYSAIFARLLEAPVAVLRRLGLNAELREVNEIQVDGKRIAGTGGGQIEEACVVVGNLLFDFDYETMARVWRVPSESFRALAKTALPEEIVTIRQLLGNVEMQSVERMLVEEYARTLGRPLQPSALTSGEIDNARMVAERLRSPEFLNLRSIQPRAKHEPLKITARAYIHREEFAANGNKIKVDLYARDGIIVRVRLQSEMPRQWEEIEKRLEGVAMQDWRGVLSNVPIS